MPRICLLSDTHSYLDDSIIEHVKSCDEVWHCGDIGSLDVSESLEKIRPLRAVFGNIDNHIIRSYYPEQQRFMCDDVDVWMTHIGGYPNRYDVRIRNRIQTNPPKLFLCGHSHILKVIYDKKLDLLHINPGAIGKNGFHKVRTLVKFTIQGAEIKDLEIVEFERR